MIEQKCCICGVIFNGYGNNPAPVKMLGRCCDRCNSTYVISARLRNIMENKKGGEPK
jgi:hypothetical protein